MTELSDNEHKILVELSRKKDITMYYMEKATGMNKSSIKHWLKKLIDKGLVTMSNGGDKTIYSVNQDKVVSVDGVMWAKIGGQVLIFGDERSELCQKISQLFKD